MALRAAAQTAPALPAAMIAGPGETKTNSLSTGQKSTLSISTSSSINSSANINSVDGFSSTASSTLQPSSGTFSSSFGGQTGSISAQVNHSKSALGENWSSTADGTAINGTHNSEIGGTAAVEGINTAATVAIDGERSGISASTQTTSQTSSNGFGNANAAGSQSMNSTMNIDLQSSSFSNAFSQSF